MHEDDKVLMSSSFRRASRSTSSNEKPFRSLRGTKAWTGGITLTSSGLRDLDAILGGGQPLGTCLLLEEDRLTRDLALCLVRYWCAEAVCNGQTLIIPVASHDDPKAMTRTSSPLLTDDASITAESPFSVGCSRAEAQEIVASLPRNLHWDKAADKESELASPSRPLEILKEDDGEEEEDAEEGLQIAWQYRKSIQQERLGQPPALTRRSEPTPSDGVYCHSYNLNGRLREQRSLAEYIHITESQCFSSDCPQQSRYGGFRLYQSWLRDLKQKLNDCNQVVRVLLYHASVEASSVALPLLLSYIRTHQLPVVVLIVTQSWTCPKKVALTSLRRTSDVVMQTEGFASRLHYPPPPEFRHLHGLLLLPKVSTVTAATANGGGGHFADMTVSKRPPANVYGLKRDRRKLHVPLLHIPPEDYAGGGSVSGGAVRSGAGMPRETKDAKTGATAQGGCGSGENASLLDF